MTWHTDGVTIRGKSVSLWRAQPRGGDWKHLRRFNFFYERFCYAWIKTRNAALLLSHLCGARRTLYYWHQVSVIVWVLGDKIAGPASRSWIKVTNWKLKLSRSGRVIIERHQPGPAYFLLIVEPVFWFAWDCTKRGPGWAGRGQSGRGGRSQCVSVSQRGGTPGVSYINTQLVLDNKCSLC